MPPSTTQDESPLRLAGAPLAGGLVQQEKNALSVALRDPHHVALQDSNDPTCNVSYPVLAEFLHRNALAEAVSDALRGQTLHEDFLFLGGKTASRDAGAEAAEQVGLSGAERDVADKAPAKSPSPSGRNKDDEEDDDHRVLVIRIGVLIGGEAKEPNLVAEENEHLQKETSSSPQNSLSIAVQEVLLLLSLFYQPALLKTISETGTAKMDEDTSKRASSVELHEDMITEGQKSTPKRSPATTYRRVHFIACPIDARGPLPDVMHQANSVFRCHCIVGIRDVVKQLHLASTQRSTTSEDGAHIDLPMLAANFSLGLPRASTTKIDAQVDESARRRYGEGVDGSGTTAGNIKEEEFSLYVDCVVQNKNYKRTRPVPPFPTWTSKTLSADKKNEQTDRVATSTQPPVLLLPTSGTTTGEPKLVTYSAPQLRLSAKAIADSLDLRTSDRCLNALPLFHIGGIACNLLAVLESGGRVGLLSKFNCHDFLHAVVERGITWYYAVPTMHRQILLTLEQEEVAGAQAIKNGVFSMTKNPSEDVSVVQQILQGRHNLRFVRSASARLHFKQIQALRRLLRVPVFSTYGMTEAMPICSPAVGEWRTMLKARTSMEPEGGDQQAGQHLQHQVQGQDAIINEDKNPNPAQLESVGKVLPGMELKIIAAVDKSVESTAGSFSVNNEQNDPEEEPVVLTLTDASVVTSTPFPLVDLPVGKVGEICVRGPRVVASAGQDDWFRTGDLGKLDAEGNLHLRGRIRDVLKRGGEQVNLFDAEKRADQAVALVDHELMAPLDRPGGALQSAAEGRVTAPLDYSNVVLTTAKRCLVKYRKQFRALAFATPSVVYGEELGLCFVLPTEAMSSLLLNECSVESISAGGAGGDEAPARSRANESSSAKTKIELRLHDLLLTLGKLLAQTVNRGVAAPRKAAVIFLANETALFPVITKTGKMIRGRAYENFVERAAVGLGAAQASAYPRMFFRPPGQRLAEQHQPRTGEGDVAGLPMRTPAPFRPSVGAPVVGRAVPILPSGSRPRSPTSAVVAEGSNITTRTSAVGASSSAPPGMPHNAEPFAFCVSDANGATRDRILHRTHGIMEAARAAIMASSTTRDDFDFVYHWNSVPTVLGLPPERYLDRMRPNPLVDRGGVVPQQQLVAQPQIMQHVVQVQPSSGSVYYSSSPYHVAYNTATPVVGALSSHAVLHQNGENMLAPRPVENFYAPPYALSGSASSATTLSYPLAPYLYQGPPKLQLLSTGGSYPALRAVRFLFACWVIQLHVGRMPTEFTAKLQSLSMDMSAFSFLAAFFTARGSARKPIEKRERRDYYINRIGLAHSLYILSTIFALPSFFIRCPPGDCKQAENAVVYWIAVPIQLLIFLTGFWPAIFVAPFNPVAWFQANYYCFLCCFPCLDEVISSEFHYHPAFFSMGQSRPVSTTSSRTPVDKAKTFYACCLTGAAATFVMVPLIFRGLFIATFLIFSWGPMFVTAVLTWKLHEAVFLPAVQARKKKEMQINSEPQMSRSATRSRVLDEQRIALSADHGSMDEERATNNSAAAQDQPAGTGTNVGVISMHGPPISGSRSGQDAIRLFPWYTNSVLWAFLTDAISCFFLFLAFYVNANDTCAWLPPKPDAEDEKRRAGGRICYSEDDRDNVSYEQYLIDSADQKRHDIGPWMDGRWLTETQFWFGTCRLITPFLLVWFLGLAGIGNRSLTYRALTTWNGMVIAKYLAPLAYPMYLLHYNVAWYYWFLTRGTTNREWWWHNAAGHPWPVEAYSETLIVILLTMLAASFLNFLLSNGFIASIGIKFMKVQCNCCGDCWASLLGTGGDCCPRAGGTAGSTSLYAPMGGEQDGQVEQLGVSTFTTNYQSAAIGLGGRDRMQVEMNNYPLAAAAGSVLPGPPRTEVFQHYTNSTHTRLAELLRQLTGAIVDSASRLDELGLDSFGTTAFTGVLRSHFPDCDVRLANIVRCETVGDLVAYLTAVNGRRSRAVAQEHQAGSSRSSRGGDGVVAMSSRNVLMANGTERAGRQQLLDHGETGGVGPRPRLGYIE
ncbi:unnamed protein product [Amoebophrya sp. A120]|nr:unnamed protein product [Amoebophrya sp. A120]|eukprot:GSA120T00000252001.1